MRQVYAVARSPAAVGRKGDIPGQGTVVKKWLGSLGYNGSVKTASNIRFPNTRMLGRIIGLLAMVGASIMPATGAGADEIEDIFDRTFRVTAQGSHVYGNPLDASIATVANPQFGRIGVAAVDLSSGRAVSVLGDQPFPMASTSKIAIVATYLDGVDKGRWTLDQQFPLMIPVKSEPFAGPVAPVRPGTLLSAQTLIDMAIIHSNNAATDALLAAVGGPQAVNRWIQANDISGMRIDRDIATLVRDDGVIDPAKTIDVRDSATPAAMLKLLSGLYRGEWLSASSRSVLMSAMERCATGKKRIAGLMPEGARVAHKTGTLANTSSDVGIIHTPDGRAMAVAIYVTGQGGKPARDQRIAHIARTIYDGYLSEASSLRRTASR